MSNHQYQSAISIFPENRRAAYNIARLVVRSLYQELSLYPKPGLVSFQDNGAHHDMNAMTFMRSIFSLRSYFFSCAMAGMRGAGFVELQQLGLDAESRMLRATCGINAHKGAIFTLGFLSAAAGYATAHKITPSDINLRDMIKNNWSCELRAISVSRTVAPSHGQLMATFYGVTGARGEALQGFPSVFDIALPALRSSIDRGVDIRLALLHAFFVLLANIKDTNILFRGGAEGLSFVQRQAKEFIDQGSVFKTGWLSRAEVIHRQCSSRRLSPGGCADLLAATYFVHKLQAGV